MIIRQKQTVLKILHTQFTEFNLPLDIEYKSYANIVGAKEALHPISLKRSFKAWKYAIVALRKAYPELDQVQEPAPMAKPEPVKEATPELKGLDALKALSSNEKEVNEDGKNL